MIQLGTVVQATITDRNPEAYFAQSGGQTFRLETSQVPEANYQIGDTIQGLIYEDKNRQARIQVHLPKISPDDFDWGTVTQVRTDLGVFVDVGIYQKDIVVSLDDLPDEKQEWPRKGDRLYLKLFIDPKNRFWGKIANIEEMTPIMIKAPERLMNQNIEATVVQLKLAGAQAITEEGFRAFIHSSEWVLPPRLGQKVAGRVVKVQTDGSLNLSLKPRAHEAIGDDATMILRVLEKAPQGYLALHDKSDPDLIKNQLGISKGQFKRAVGSLLKDRLIRQEINDGIYLLKDQ